MNKRLDITLGRLLALLIGVPLALLAIGAFALDAVAFAGQGSYPVRLALPAPGHLVTVSVQSGDMRVSQGPDGRLGLIGTARYGLVRSRVAWHVGKSGLIVDSRCLFATWICEFNYRVVLPAGLAVSLSDSSGTITATGLTEADMTVSSDSGDITLSFSKVPDRVTVDDSFGDIMVVLPAGHTTYKVNAQAPLGMSSVTVPASSSSVHVITVTDQSGNISVTN